MDALNQHTLTAFFRDRDDAEEATRKLAAAGISGDNVRLVPGKEPDSLATTDLDNDRKGFWESLGDFFFPDNDREVYAEGLRRGGYLVTVTNIADTLHQTAVDILDDEGTIDVDEWSESWRADGWAPTNPGFDRDPALNDPRVVRAGGLAEETSAEEREARREQDLIGRRDLDASGNRVRSYIYDKPENQLGTPPRV